MKFILNSLMWFCLELPMILFSFVVVAILLQTNWDGKSTWFGNWQYGIKGNSHMPSNPSKFDIWWFLCIRNPVSNFGTKILSVKDSKWVWWYDQHIIGNFYWQYGWKNPTVESKGLRTFVYRPWIHK